MTFTTLPHTSLHLIPPHMKVESALLSQLEEKMSEGWRVTLKTRKTTWENVGNRVRREIQNTEL